VVIREIKTKVLKFQRPANQIIIDRLRCAACYIPLKEMRQARKNGKI